MRAACSRVSLSFSTVLAIQHLVNSFSRVCDTLYFHKHRIERINYILWGFCRHVPTWTTSPSIGSPFRLLDAWVQCQLTHCSSIFRVFQDFHVGAPELSTAIYEKHVSGTRGGWNTKSNRGSSQRRITKTEEREWEGKIDGEIEKTELRDRESDADRQIDRQTDR